MIHLLYYKQNLIGFSNMVEAFDSSFDSKAAQYSLDISNRLLSDLGFVEAKTVEVANHIINLLFLNDYYTINQRYKKVIADIDREKAVLLLA